MCRVNCLVHTALLAFSPAHNTRQGAIAYPVTFSTVACKGASAMIDKSVVSKICEKIGPFPSMEKPTRYVDYALASSFAHCTCNLTSDEVFGYALIDRVRERLGVSAPPFLLQDYDGTYPHKEKPSAYFFQNLLKDESGNSLSLPLLFSYNSTIESQPFDRELLLRSINTPWEYLVKSSFQKEDRELFKERFTQLVKILYECAASSSSTLEFISSTRRKFLECAGISSFGVPESTVREVQVQKLEEDLEAGFPFWRMELPESFRVKHQSNGRTYLFYARTDSGSLNPVKFFTNPERFEIQRNGQVESILAEESINAMRRGVLIPTVSVLNYICLSPARKKPSTESRNRIHLGGQFM
jgi:hypothetical protein